MEENENKIFFDQLCHISMIQYSITDEGILKLFKNETGINMNSLVKASLILYILRHHISDNPAHPHGLA